MEREEAARVVSGFAVHLDGIDIAADFVGPRPDRFKGGHNVPSWLSVPGRPQRPVAIVPQAPGGCKFLSGRSDHPSVPSCPPPGLSYFDLLSLVILKFEISDLESSNFRFSVLSSQIWNLKFQILRFELSNLESQFQILRFFFRSSLKN